MRRLLVPDLGDAGLLATARMLVRRLRDVGEPTMEPSLMSEATGTFLRVGRSAPGQAELASWIAALAGTSAETAWVEGTDGVPLDVLERRIAVAAGVSADRFRPHPDAPACMSIWRSEGLGVEVILHAPMDAATMDLGRLVGCPTWAVTPQGELRPACWAAVGGAGGPEE